MDQETFLLYDYVHVMKCMRNNWLTEISGELEFEFEGHVLLAKWSDLKLLHEAESNSLIKLSKLNAVAVAPKPIERQKVSTCLRVFCDETIAALESHPKLDGVNVHGTLEFIRIIVRFWKIVNVRGPGADIRFKDIDRGVIRTPDDPR